VAIILVSTTLFSPLSVLRRVWLLFLDYQAALLEGLFPVAGFKQKRKAPSCQAGHFG